MTALNILLPLGSTLVGAGITYVINVRQRRRNYREDLVNDAIAAVAAAEVSVDYLASVGRPTYMTDRDFEQFQSWLVTEGMKSWATQVAGANEAVARTIPYVPAVAALLPFGPDAGHRGTHEPIIAMLRASTSRAPKRRAG